MRWPRRIPADTTCRAITRSIDFLPTFAEAADAPRPDPHRIDGVDLSPLLDDPGTEPPNNTFVYYLRNNLMAIRVDDWKLHLHEGGENQRALFNLRDDIGETTDLAESRPDIVERLLAACEPVRDALGDAATGATGRENRPHGRVAEPRALTEYREDHPYMVALYDLPDMPTLSG